MSETILSAKVVETFIDGQKYVGFEIQTDVKTHRLCVEERAISFENRFASINLSSHEEFRWTKYVIKNNDATPDDDEECVVAHDMDSIQNELDKIVGWQCIFEIRCDQDEYQIILYQNKSVMIEFSVYNNIRRNIRCFVESGISK